MIVAFVAIIGWTYIFLNGLEHWEEYTLSILSFVLLVFSILNFESSVIDKLKLFFFLSQLVLACYMMLNATDNGIVIALAQFWFTIFTLGLASRNREGVFYKFNLLALMLMVPLISFRAVYAGGDVSYFADNRVFNGAAMFLGSILAFLGILISHLDHQERDKASKEKDQSINWFSTLVNLVAHNLRSP